MSYIYFIYFLAQQLYRNHLAGSQCSIKLSGEFVAESMISKYNLHNTLYNRLCLRSVRIKLNSVQLNWSWD